MILCLGDSHTFGVAVPAERAYPAQLARRLAEHGLVVNVVNLGAPGTNTSQIRRRLPEWLERYQPMVIVVLAGVNDGWNAEEVLMADLADGMLQGQPGKLWRARMRNALSYLKSYRLAAYLLRRVSRGRKDIEQAQRRDGEPVFHNYNPAEACEADFADAERAQRNFRRIVELCRERRVQPIFMTYIGVPSVAEFEGPNYALREAAKELQVPLLDNDRLVRPQLLDSEGNLDLGRAMVLFLPDAHPTAAGYSLIADNLARFLLEQGLLKKEATTHDQF